MKWKDHSDKKPYSGLAGVIASRLWHTASQRVTVIILKISFWAFAK